MIKKPVKVNLTLYSLPQAVEFVSHRTQIGERLALDLEDREVRDFFDDPGYCSCELTFPNETLENVNAELAAAREVGAEITLTVERVAR